MKKLLNKRILPLIVLLGLVFIATIADAKVIFRPAPYQDTFSGRNSYAYNPAANHPTESEKRAFIQELKDYALQAQAKYGVPASAIIAMASVESGYGFTQIAYYANNLFGMKVWGVNPPNAWQLKGQPDEDGGSVRILENYGSDRIIYDELNRRDNWYRAFESRQAAVEYLAGTLLQKSRYKPALESYQNRIKTGWSLSEASKEYCYDIAKAGYNHLGGAYYRDRIGKIMDMYNLYQYDGTTKNKKK